LTHDKPEREQPDHDRGVRLVAAMAALLARYTDRSELLIAYAAAPDIAPRPVALDLKAGPSFAELVAQVQRALAAGVDGHETAEPDAVVAVGQDPPSGPHADWLSVRPGDGGLGLALHRNGAGADVRPAEHVIGNLQTLLAGAEAEPDRPLAEIAVLTATERQRLLVELNRTAAPYPDACLHQLFAEQAARTPDAIAVQSSPTGSSTSAQVSSRTT